MSVNFEVTDANLQASRRRKDHHGCCGVKNVTQHLDESQEADSVYENGEAVELVVPSQNFLLQFIDMTDGSEH